MSELKANLSNSDKKFREFILSDNMWRVILRISLPLMAYQGLMHIFKIFDTLMAAHISSDAVSSIAFISQISFLIQSIGNGLSIGAGMKISEAYGAGDYTLVKRRVSTVYVMCAIVSALVMLIIPFNESFLRMSGTPETMIAIGSKYFAVEVASIVLNFFTSVYIAIERARGNSRLILKLNILFLTIKLVLTAIFVYALSGDVVMIAMATLIAQLVFFAIAVRNMRIKDNLFGFSFSAVSFKKEVFLPVLKTSYPAMIERAAFAYGKLIVNSMCTHYGDLTVGALGVSNNISGTSTALQNGFQDGGSSIISQNVGAGEHGRALDAFRKTFIINTAIGLVLSAVILIFLDFISSFFSSGDPVFHEMIKDVTRYELMGVVTLGMNAAVMALLYGYGYTKLTLVLNAARLFVFRIPVLWYLQNFTDYGSESAGIVMMVSNISVGVMAVITSIFVVQRIKKKYIKNSAES